MRTAIAEAEIHETPAESGVNYLNVTYGIKSWLLTLDHKRIGLLYLGSITLMFFVGGMAAVLMRLHLVELVLFNRPAAPDASGLGHVGYCR